MVLPAAVGVSFSFPLLLSHSFVCSLLTRCRYGRVIDDDREKLGFSFDAVKPPKQDTRDDFGDETTAGNAEAAETKA